MDIYDIEKSYQELGDKINDLILQRDLWKKTAEYIFIKMSSSKDSYRLISDTEYRNSSLEQLFDEANYSSSSLNNS